MRVAIVDYQAGNLRNVQKAVERLNHAADIVQRAEALADADVIILPGVGAFGHGMENLAQAGFVEALRREVLEKGKPLLGICLGMHLLGTRGFELALVPFIFAAVAQVIGRHLRDVRRRLARRRLGLPTSAKAHKGVPSGRTNWRAPSG